MKFSLESIKISIAGAKLSHLVQKDRIWDHGSMTEQARIIFHLVHKTRASGNLESLKKQSSDAFFEKLQKNPESLNRSPYNLQNENPVIIELAIISVQPGHHNNPDKFKALIKGYYKTIGYDNPEEINKKKFSEEWSFICEGGWWVLDGIK